MLVFEPNQSPPGQEETYFSPVTVFCTKQQTDLIVDSQSSINYEQERFCDIIFLKRILAGLNMLLQILGINDLLMPPHRKYTSIISISSQINPWMETKQNWIFVNFRMSTLAKCT